jgi:hypothetical protein
MPAAPDAQTAWPVPPLPAGRQLTAAAGDTPRENDDVAEGEGIQSQIDCLSTKSADNSSSDCCCNEAHSAVKLNHLLERSQALVYQGSHCGVLRTLRVAASFDLQRTLQ